MKAQAFGASMFEIKRENLTLSSASQINVLAPRGHLPAKGMGSM